MIKAFAAAALVAACTLPAQAVTVVRWDFESLPSSLSVAGKSYAGVSASTGTGSAGGVHAGSGTFSSPVGNGSSRSLSATNWAVGDYWQFSFSTTGYTQLVVSFDETGSNTGPRDFALAYSTNGVSFTSFASYSLINGGWLSGTPVASTKFTYDLSAIAALNQAASVTLRLVDASTTSIVGATVASGGTSRVDNFTVSMTPVPVPEPQTCAMFAAGFAALGFVTRRRQA